MATNRRFPAHHPVTGEIADCLCGNQRRIAHPIGKWCPIGIATYVWRNRDPYNPTWEGRGLVEWCDAWARQQRQKRAETSFAEANHDVTANSPYLDGETPFYVSRGWIVAKRGRN